MPPANREQNLAAGRPLTSPATPKDPCNKALRVKPQVSRQMAIKRQICRLKLPCPGGCAMTNREGGQKVEGRGAGTGVGTSVCSESQNLMGGLKACPGCGGGIPGVRADQVYCSERCRTRAYKRRLRLRRRPEPTPLFVCRCCEKPVFPGRRGRRPHPPMCSPCRSVANAKASKRRWRDRKRAKERNSDAPA
jgi:hypothetical protein